jgi:hypothetical protein
VHGLHPRHAKHEPAVKGELVVAPAVARDLVALGVELVAVSLDHDAQVAVDEVRVDRPTGNADRGLWLQPQTWHAK